MNFFYVLILIPVIFIFLNAEINFTILQFNKYCYYAAFSALIKANKKKTYAKVTRKKLEKAFPFSVNVFLYTMYFFYRCYSVIELYSKI